MSSGIRQILRRAFSNPAWVCFVWFGMSAGIVLLATPIRFTAQSITRPVALDVGRAVFTALNRAELMALVVLLIVVRVSGRAAQWWAIGGVLALILIAQNAWLLPELSARTDMILAGREPPASHLHATYSSLELLKLAILLLGGFTALGENR